MGGDGIVYRRSLKRRATRYRSEFVWIKRAWWILYVGEFAAFPRVLVGQLADLPKYAQREFIQALHEESERLRQKAANRALNAQQQKDARLRKEARRRAHKALTKAQKKAAQERSKAAALAQHKLQAAAVVSLPPTTKREMRTQRLLSELREKKRHMELLGPRRSRKLSVARRQALTETGGHCVYCNGAPGYSELTVEHLLPRSRGGCDTYDNLTAACKTCNNDRGNQEDFVHLVCERWRPFVLWKLGGCVGPEFAREGSKSHIPTIKK